MSKDYHSIYQYYESCHDKHGNVPEGFDWPNQKDLDLRFEVLTDVIRPGKPCSLLDLGCGSGFLLDYLAKHDKLKDIEYHGLDISEKFIEIARKNHPGASFECRDILSDPLEADQFDYIILNGVFTMKMGLKQEEMLAFIHEMLKQIYNSAREGIAFNVMSKLVDWERDELFHIGMDELGHFLWKNLSRHFIFRNDYGLYEYSSYVYKSPTS